MRLATDAGTDCRSQARIKRGPLTGISFAVQGLGESQGSRRSYVRRSDPAR